MSPWDAVIVGGGPAGLAAALWLARYRRRTLLLDDERPRNEAAWAVHGYPGLSDPRPAELRARMREQATSAGAVLERRRAVSVSGRKGAFAIVDGAGDTVAARRVLLAYGRADRLPDVPGIVELYGTSVFHCPDCDGPSVAGCRVGVIGHGRAAAALALYLLTWADRATLLTHGLDPSLEPAARATLAEHHVDIVTEPIESLVQGEGRLRAVRVRQGEVRLDALFFHWGSDPSASVARDLGCDHDAGGDVVADSRTLETSVPGAYAAGDLIGLPHLAISAAADGVRAALAIHRSLLPREFQL